MYETVDWQCPACERTFTTLADDQRPYLCPDCEQGAWYCQVDGQEYGPFSIEELQERNWRPDTLVRCGKSGNWFPPQTVPELCGVQKTSPKRGKQRRKQSRSSIGVIVAAVLGAMTALGVWALLRVPTGNAPKRPAHQTTDTPDRRVADNQRDAADRGVTIVVKEPATVARQADDWPAIAPVPASVASNEIGSRETSEPMPKQVSASANRLAIPDEAAQEESARLIRDLYKTEYAKANTSEEELVLARFLFQKAEAEVKDNPVDRYVLLSEAKSTGIPSGNAQFVLGVVRTLAETYEVDSVTMRLETLAALKDKVRFLSDFKAFLEEGYPLVDVLLAEQKIDATRSLAEACEAVARKARIVELTNRAKAEVARIEQIQQELPEVETAMEKLEADPNDPDANLTVGRYRCFFLKDWESGLPLLAECSDEKLKAVARKELQSSPAGKELLILADEWLELSKAYDEPVKRQMLLRALSSYQQAQPQLAGLDAVRVAKQLTKLSEVTATLDKLFRIRPIKVEMREWKRIPVQLAVSIRDAKTPICDVFTDTETKYLRIGDKALLAVGESAAFCRLQLPANMLSFALKKHEKANVGIYLLNSTAPARTLSFSPKHGLYTGPTPQAPRQVLSSEFRGNFDQTFSVEIAPDKTTLTANDKKFQFEAIPPIEAILIHFTKHLAAVGEFYYQ